MFLVKIFDFVDYYRFLFYSKLRYEYLKLKCGHLGNFAGDNFYYATGFYSNNYSHLYIGRGCTFSGEVNLAAHGKITIGDNCMFAHGAKVLTGTHDYKAQPMSTSYETKDVVIGSNVWVGSNALILPGVIIGDNVAIGAGSVVTKNLPSNVVAVGNPARVLKEIKK